MVDLRRLSTTYLLRIRSEFQSQCNVSYKRKSRWPPLVSFTLFAVYSIFGSADIQEDSMETLKNA